MKTTKQKLLSMIITASVTINLVMLGGLGYIATIDTHINHAYTVMNSPMVIYVHKNIASPGDTTATPVATPTQ